MSEFSKVLGEVSQALLVDRMEKNRCQGGLVTAH